MKVSNLAEGPWHQAGNLRVRGSIPSTSRQPLTLKKIKNVPRHTLKDFKKITNETSNFCVIIDVNGFATLFMRAKNIQ